MALNPSSGWKYRKKLEITDTANASADYQIRLKVYAGNGDDNVAEGIVYCDNKCENFPNDIRFGTTSDPGTATQLAQWIESHDSTQATIWVKCPSDGSDTFYMFAGNSAATFYSNGSEVWDFYEEWTTDYTGEYIEVKRSGYHDYGHYRSISGISIPYRQLTRIKINTWDPDKYGSDAGQGTANDTDNYVPTNGIWTRWSCDTDVGAGSSTVAWRPLSRVNGTTYYTDWQTFPLQTWYKNEIKVTSSKITATVYNDDYSSKLAEATLNNVPSATGAYNYYGEYTADTRDPGKSWAYHGDPDYCLGYGGWRGSISHIELYSPWTVIGKYADPEPAWSSFGAWEEIARKQIILQPSRFFIKRMREKYSRT